MLHSELTCLIIYCRRPTPLQDRTRDSEDDDYQDRDYDVAALANNLSQAFRYGMCSNDDMDEVHFQCFEIIYSLKFNVSYCLESMQKRTFVGGSYEGA